MQEVDGQLVLSASDLNDFLACPHLTTLELARAKGEVGPPTDRGVDSDLLAEKGDEHEADYLQSLKDEGRQVLEIATDDGSRESLLTAVAATEEAMRSGVEVIFQGAFLRDGMRGHTDFLFRVERPSALGDWSYEVADTKLARRAKPYFVVQLCFYSELLAASQGLDPEHLHVILGDRSTQTFRVAEFAAYFRHVRDAFIADLETGLGGTYPEPVAHCQVCRWRERCDAQWVADDHLSLVANINRRQRDQLTVAKVATLEALGSAENLSVEGIDQEVLGRLQKQAALQLAARHTGELSYELRPPAEGRGFARLPKPSPGDVFFDMEGDPYFADGGLEYLFGYVTGDPGAPEFEAIWGKNRGEERLAVERFIDLMTERRKKHSDLHIYHYNHYEVTALKRLASTHGTREDELDELLRGEVFVDLLKVVREALLISQPSYSIKKVEAYYMDERDTGVTDGGDSVIEFERWLEEGDDAILAAIADYNRDDCVSTLLLRDWLLTLRSEALGKFDGTAEAALITWFEPSEREGPSEKIRAWQEENEALMRRLVQDLPDDPEEYDKAASRCWLMAQLLEYHHREARPVHWAKYARLEAEPAALIDDPDCIGGLVHDDETPAYVDAKSTVDRLRFPQQETKIRAGSKVLDAADGANPGNVVAIDGEAGWLELKRGSKLGKRPFPKALIPPGPLGTSEQQKALRRLAEAILTEGSAAYGAARQILDRESPQLTGREPGSRIDGTEIETAQVSAVVAAMEESHLFIQGPPGAGKTFTAARVIVDLIGDGKRVGVTSTSHRVIHNLLEEVERVADEQTVSFRGLKKCSDDNPESAFDSPHGLIESVDSNKALNDPEVALTAGTAWHYCLAETDQLDFLFIDEAGQISLADALALSTAARNVVLLGDPQQLPQVSVASHPAGASLSVLEHLLGDRQTVARERGIFLDRTWRMHPNVTEFISELMYDGRLHSAEGRELQRVESAGELSETGLRWLPVEHFGRSQSSPEEADQIKEAIDALLDHSTFTDCDGDDHPLRPEDVLVLTPYNAQVRCLEERMPPGVRVGTVDKFQGQEAQVAFFSMATSSGEEVPRNVEFLFSRNRLNVAISRARCLAVLVCNPRLLDIRANTIEQMRLVNALCALREYAERE